MFKKDCYFYFECEGQSECTRTRLLIDACLSDCPEYKKLCPEYKKLCPCKGKNPEEEKVKIDYSKDEFQGCNHYGVETSNPNDTPIKSEERLYSISEIKDALLSALITNKGCLSCELVRRLKGLE